MRALRKLTKDDVTVMEINGYHIKRLFEYRPLGLRKCVTLRVWYKAGDCFEEERAMEQALAHFNEELARIDQHLDNLAAAA